MASGRKKNGKKDTNFATWKFQLENTVNADPKLGPACLSVVRAYLDWMGSPDTRPFLSIIHLRVLTSLTEHTIIRARRELEATGYFIPDGKNSAGATRYKIINAGEARVLDHITIARETLVRLEAEKKDNERSKRMQRARTAENAGLSRPAETAGPDRKADCTNCRDSTAETAGNYVYDDVEVISNEGKGIIRGVPFYNLERGSLRRFPIPANAIEGRNFLTARNVPVDKVNLYLPELMEGELRPFDIEEWWFDG